MEQMFKKYIQSKLQNYVVRYFKAHPEVRLVCVVGSVGKTSTKNAIATLLDFKFRVGGGFENHNTELSAPLAILGIKYPSNVRSLMAWRKVFKACEMRINQPATVDVIVQELATDKPGDLAVFGKYLKPDLMILTAVAEEHMEAFGTLEEVAKEEVSALNFAKRALINRDDVAPEYAKYLTNQNVITYGSSANAEYSFIVENFSPNQGFKGRFIGPNVGVDNQGLPIAVRVYGEHSLRAVTAAIAVGIQLGMNGDELVQGAATIHPTYGRMNFLPGQKGSLIIDDTYNSAPASAEEALRTLYSLNGSQRIAVLGSMNELGNLSAAEHQRIGSLCSPAQLDWVITVGDEAEKYLAPAAAERGCAVRSFKTSVEAGGFVNRVMKYDAVVLFKGSQDKIFMEEAVKIILASTDLYDQLVRQSAAWQARKQEFFAQAMNVSTEDEEESR